ncbi:GNAT family N-acetyltransferase [Nocardia brasiliensis]
MLIEPLALLDSLQPARSPAKTRRSSPSVQYAKVGASHVLVSDPFEYRPGQPGGAHRRKRRRPAVPADRTAAGPIRRAWTRTQPNLPNTHHIRAESAPISRLATKHAKDPRKIVNTREEVPMLSIEMVPTEDAADTALTAELTDLVNRVYKVAEAGLWRDGASRTTTSELRGLITAGQIAVAREDHRIVGAVCIQQLSDGIGEFGMLVCAPERRGTGIGRALVDFAERHCVDQGARTMQLELLVPRNWTHPVKESLHGWYQRLGYVLERKGELEESYPHLVPLLATPCDFLIFHKPMRRLAAP